MKIDVVCPLYEAATVIDGFLARLNAQTGVEIEKIVFPVTVCKDSNETVEKLKRTEYIEEMLKRDGKALLNQKTSGA